LRLFEEIMLPHLDAAYNLARWLTRNEQDAEDVVQEAYLRALRFFDSFAGGDGKAWLLTVVRNTYLTRWRREREGTKVTFDETIHSSQDTANAEITLARKDATDTLRACLDSLPAEYREVLIMRELEEMPYKEIAQAVSLPIGTVMSRLSRARRRLQGCMAGVIKG
jgi:RNA polymerase sigma-70 factor (ECF subfamily)